MSNERSRDVGGAPSPGSDQGGADRRDPGADALLELARLIGGQGDPFAPDASKAEPLPPEPRPSDVSRAAATPTDPGREPFSRPQERSFGDRFEARPPLPDRGASGRRGPAFAADSGPSEPRDAPSELARTRNFDFAEPDGGNYPVAPRQGGAAYRRRHDDYSEEYAEGGGYGEHDEYDEEEAPRRRPTKVIMVVLGLAVFGSAAAYGYRVLVNAGVSGPPPIIRADSSPSKITPMSDVKADIGRTSDRIGERMVRRDEDPVDVGASADAGASDTMPGAAAGLPGDPKRVHTVPIRAEQGTASSPDRPAAAPAQQPAPQALPQSPPRQAVAVPPPPQPAPAPPPRQAVAVPPPPRPAPAPPPLRQAAVAAPGPPPESPAAALVESGGYVVQLSAVRSEADAQTAFRQMQAKYPVLSGHHPLIRRKDQGERGTFFAAQVGPFAKGDADQLCGELKAAGGSCFVQRN